MRRITSAAPLFRRQTAGRLVVLSCCICLLSLLLTVQTAYPYPAILEIVLNQEERGAFFIEATDDGDFLLSEKDFSSLGLPLPESAPIPVDGENFYSLSTHERLTFKLNEATLSLEIEVKPDILPLQRIDFTNKRPDNIHTSEESSFFLNYGLSAAGNKDESLQSLDLTHEIAGRTGKTLFLSDGIYTRTTTDSGYIRLMSRFIHDDRNRMRRLSVGDHSVVAGPLGGRVLLGGLGFAKHFEIDPYYINYPAVEMHGVTATPSTAEVFIDGVLVRKQELPPGPFVLENITRYEGAGDVEIVIRDAFNKEQRIRHPFYLAEQILTPGTHEFSYNVGGLREDFGVASNNYGDTVFSGYHRYGYRDWLTLGVAGEYSPDFFSLAPRLSMKWQQFGYLDLAIGASSGNGDTTGTAAALEYLYQNYRFSIGMKLRHFSEDYVRLDDFLRTDTPQLESHFRIGYASPDFGSLNLGLASTSYHSGDKKDNASLTYNRRLARNLSMYATINRISEVTDETILLIGFNYAPWRQHSVGTRIESREKSSALSVSLQRDPPGGIGYGYRTSVDINHTETSDSYALRTAGQHNSQPAVIRGELDLASIDSEFRPSYLASLSGAIVHIGNSTHLTRPVRDSFALVKTGDIEGVRVVKNSETIGRTDKNGMIIIPELTSYYDNEISLKDEDIPIEYGMETSRAHVQPPLRSGSCILFSAKRIQPLIGKFRIRIDGRTLPYEYRPLIIRVGNSVLDTQTGHDGEFYIDTSEAGSGHAVTTGCVNLAPATTESEPQRLQIEFSFDDTTGIFNLDVPESDELFIEMGNLVLNAREEDSQEK